MKELLNYLKFMVPAGILNHVYFPDTLLNIDNPKKHLQEGQYIDIYYKHNTGTRDVRKLLSVFKCCKEKVPTHQVMHLTASRLLRLESLNININLFIYKDTYTCDEDYSLPFNEVYNEYCKS